IVRTNNCICFFHRFYTRFYLLYTHVPSRLTASSPKLFCKEEMSYASKSTKSFDFDDVDDSTFLNHPRQGSTGYILSNNPAVRLEDQRQQLLEEKQRVEERTLQSTKNSLAL